MTLASGPNLGVLVSGAQGEQHFSEFLRLLRALDGLVQANAKDRDLAAPPGSPADGDIYVVAAAASGAWAGQSTKIARWNGLGSAWEFLTPRKGWRIWLQDEDLPIVFNGTAWALEPAASGGSGDVVGPASAADNTLPRYDGTTGKLLQGSGVVVTDDNEISGYRGNVNRQTGTSYTLLAADSGKIVELANASAIALTADPTLPKGFACTIVQAGAGVVTIASSGSGTVVNRQSHTKTAGLEAICSIYVRSNSGSNAAFVLGGDTAP